MDHLITCECGKSTRISRSQAGQEIHCDCGKTILIPTLRGLSELPVAPDSESNRAPESSSWAGWRGTTLAVSVGLCAIFAAPCVFFLYQRLQIDTSYTVESEIEAGNKDFDSQSMEQLTTIWYSFETSGLGIKQKPTFYYYNRFAKDREIWAAITGSLAAICGAVAAFAWLTTPKNRKQSA